MDSNTYTDISGEGRITGNVFPFTEEIATRKSNVRLINSDHLYPGGAEDASHIILEKELVLGWRNTESIYGERGFSSLSGMITKNLEATLRNTYFIGVAGPKVDANARDQCLTVFKSGTDTVLNGPREVFPGQLLCYQFPDPKHLPKRTYGTAHQKVLPMLVPFDHTNTKLQTRAIRASIQSSDPEFGVDQLTIEDLDEPGLLAPIQEEALGIKYGEMLKVARVMEAIDAGTGLTFLETIGLFETNETRTETQKDKLKAAIDALFRPLDQDKNQKRNTAEEMFYQYGSDAFEISHDALAGAFIARTSTIVGRALSGAKPYKSIDVNFGDTKLTY